MISKSNLIRASLKQHGRIHAAVALGVATATAVLTGALLVGDSVRGSLRHLVLDRLGRIDEVIVADRFFSPDLAEHLLKDPSAEANYAAAVPAIFVQGTVETASADLKARASKVTIIGSGKDFWSLGSGGPTKTADDDEIILNQPLADELHAKVGDDVILRIGQASQIPADSPLGRKTETTRNKRLKVSAIIPAEGLGRFGLRPNQQLPLDAFVATEALQAMLEQTDKVNAIFVVNKAAADASASEPENLAKALRPSLADLGYQLKETPQGYLNFTSTRMLLDPAAERAAQALFGDQTSQTAFTYLANCVKVDGGKGKIPYSTVTAVDPVNDSPLGPFTTTTGEVIDKLADDEILLNRWAADDLAKQGVEVKPGDEVAIEYFEPESTHGEVREKTARFRLKAIIEMTPIVADRAFTPELPGVTDQKSIDDWNPPFPYDDTRVRSRKPHDEDEAYWRDYKATPKAFISLAAGRQLWSSRFGDATSLRVVPKAGENVAILEQQLLARLNPTELGFQFLPVKRWGLQAAAGTTPFNALFIGFSFFIVAAAIMLVALLFRLGVEQRASEIGTLLAVGFRWKAVAGLLLGEAAIVAAIAGAIGTLLGVSYAWLMLAGLRTWWLDAIRTPFLQLYVTPISLIVGFAIGVLVSLLTVVGTLWRMRKIAVRRMLAGQASDESEIVPNPARARRSHRIGMALAAVAVVTALLAGRLSGEAQAGAFFGSGAMALAAALVLVANRLRNSSNQRLITGGKLAIARLAARNAARNPRRSSLTIGLVAAAAFLIVAISAFRLDPSAEGIGKDSGSGGYALVAESSNAIYQDLNTTAGRADLGFSTQDDTALNGTTTIGLRVQPGDDASCLNLYQTTQPRAIGLPETFIERGGFAWAGTLAETPAEKLNPLLLLNKGLPPVDKGRRPLSPVPVILDANTAMYSLHVGLGGVLRLTDGLGRSFPALVVGLLKNSIFQGDLLMSESEFLQRFPDVNGCRMFLVEAPAEKVAAAQSALENALGDYGFDAERTTDRLADFFAVQNTYLSTFQSLGGLGLLLGTFGVVAVQLRSVLERRGELALLRATGFRRRRLAQMVMLENAILLVGGLGVGTFCALIAVLPHWLSGAAATPWRSLAGTLLLVLAVGLIAGTLAVRSALRAPLLAALRGN